MSAGPHNSQASGASAASPRQPFMAFVSDQASTDVLRQFAAAQQWPTSVIRQGDITTAAQVLKDHPSPEVLLVEINTAEAAATQLDALADVCDPGVKVLVTGTINEYSFYCWLTEVGVTSYLLKPLAHHAIETAWQKTTQPAATTADPKEEHGKIIALLGTRGGVGTSTLAVHLAGMVAANSKKPTALLDLDPQMGVSSLLLDLEPGRGLREALEKPDRIDGLFLERVMIKGSGSLSIMSTEEGLEETVHATEGAADALLKETTRKFAYVIVDLPRQYNPLTRKIMTKADPLFLVSDMSLSGLRDAIRIHDLFKDKLRIKPPVVIANKVGYMAKHEMKRSEFEKGLGNKVTHTVPFAEELFVSGALAEKPDKNSSAAGIAALRQIAHTIIPHTIPQGAAKKKKAGSFFSFWGGR